MEHHVLPAQSWTNSTSSSKQKKSCRVPVDDPTVVVSCHQCMQSDETGSLSWLKCHTFTSPCLIPSKWCAEVRILGQPWIFLHGLFPHLLLFHSFDQIIDLSASCRITLVADPIPQHQLVWHEEGECLLPILQCVGLGKCWIGIWRRIWNAKCLHIHPVEHIIWRECSKLGICKLMVVSIHLIVHKRHE